MEVARTTLIGMLIFGGIYCQFKLMQKDYENDDAKRIYPAIIAGAILILGVAADSIFAVFDGRRSLPFLTALANVGRVIVLALSIVLKSYLAPITVAFTLICTVYFLFTYGELRTVPLIQSLFEWAFPTANKGLSAGYVALIVAYSLGGAAHDGDIDLS